MGRFGMRKTVKAVRTVARVVYSCLTKEADVLYYPTSGPRFLAALRDIAIMSPTRWLFKKMVLHFHGTNPHEAHHLYSLWLLILIRRSLSNVEYCNAFVPSRPPDDQLIKDGWFL